MPSNYEISNIVQESEYSVSEIDIVDYSTILDKFGIRYFPSGYYWQCEEPARKQGWILHLSVIRIQIQALLNLILPELKDSGIAFKIIRDYDIAGSLMEGSLGYGQIGKIIAIYPNDEKDALKWVKKLIQQTSEFRGPRIPTDRHLSSIVYTRFGSFPTSSVDIANKTQDFIINNVGQKIPDVEQIPFSLYPWLKWPFEEITNPVSPVPTKLLNRSYYPISVLKSDAKGNVIRALYFEKPWRIKNCIIKQGRMHMFDDEVGRDIRDRLLWQYELYKELSNEIPCPTIFSLFKDGDDTYLAMEYIKGISLAKRVQRLFSDSNWTDLSISIKLKLLNTLIEIIEIISRIHKKGYVHRDITPENFMIDKNKKIHLIDLELAFDLAKKLPYPPFRLGTFGFMSPEQFNGQVPSIKEDIYGIGGLMISVFTNLPPIKFSTYPKENLKNKMRLLINNEAISNLIAECMSDSPAERPELLKIKQIILEYKNSIKKIQKGFNNPVTIQERVESCDLTKVILNSITGLSMPELLSPKLRWASISLQQELNIGNPQTSFDIYPGWHRGVSGPLWLIAIANKLGYSIKSCEPAYYSSLGYLQDTYFTSNAQILQSGLYSGGAGMALALTEGINSNLVQPNEKNLSILRSCFSNPSTDLDLANGLSGDGIALLQASQWLDKSFYAENINNCIQKIKEGQLKDGSWSTKEGEGNKNIIFTGLDHGVAGITIFLLEYLKYHPDRQVEEMAIKSLEWLVNKAKVKRGVYLWEISTKEKAINPWNSSSGIPGIILVMIKAYEIFREEKFKNIANTYNKLIIPRPVIVDLTLATGLSGIGEIYLEGAKIFNDINWQERADWIAALLGELSYELGPEASYWFTGINNIVTADLFNGSGGILHYLMRYKNPGITHHPLLTQ